MDGKVIGYIYLDEEDVSEIHEDQLNEHGGMSGIRNRDALSSAVSQPQATFGSKDLYEDIYIKAAVLAYSIAESQIFIDGNKRAALASALTFLRVNGYQILPEEHRLYDAMIAIANKTMTKENLAKLFRDLVLEYQSGS